MKSLYWFAGIGAGIVLILGGCGGSKPEGPALVVVGEETITPDQFANEWNAHQAMAGEFKPASPQELLDDMILEKLILQEARREGLDQEDSFQQEMRDFQDRLLVETYLNREVLSIPRPREEEIEAYYRSHRPEFEVPELIRVSHMLLVPGEGEEMSTAGAQAQEVLRQLQEGGDFGELATAVSKGTAASRGGDLGYFRPGQLPTELESVVWTMETDTFAGPIESEYGYFLVKVTDRKEPRVKTFEESRDEAMARLEVEKRKARLDEVRASLEGKYPPRVDNDLLRTLALPVPGASGK
ncbi:MAG TPA: peptidylprolyl isomerase [bacterium]|nr:peptidylprolyl isomerase [bacterium]HPJ71834.1 peptidylprolyl isomerase [bacterium]HPQ66378.1 peptidylprolyl isomerase [bacterium]